MLFYEQSIRRDARRAAQAISHVNAGMCGGEAAQAQVRELNALGEGK